MEGWYESFFGSLVSCTPTISRQSARVCRCIQKLPNFDVKTTTALPSVPHWTTAPFFQLHSFSSILSTPTMHKKGYEIALCSTSNPLINYSRYPTISSPFPPHFESKPTTPKPEPRKGFRPKVCSTKKMPNLTANLSTRQPTYLSACSRTL